MLVAQLEKTIKNLRYNRPKHGFTFSTYIECHKDAYQSMLVLAKKTNYVTYNPITCIHHFLNGIMGPALAQAKLSLEANCEQYSVDFDATIEYLMNQVSLHQVNQQLHIASVGIGAPGCIKTRNDCCNDIEMPLKEHLHEE